MYHVRRTRNDSMPTTINLRNLPDQLVRSAKAVAAERGITLKDFVIRVLSQKIAGTSWAAPVVAPAESPHRNNVFSATPERAEGPP
jgi:hypothetical protein